uniref:Uncharacterized protein n=1 Tax=Romanomermis culicivorax TaxID=13658 RepID=A0A915IKP6_ROMCU
MLVRSFVETDGLHHVHLFALSVMWRCIGTEFVLAAVSQHSQNPLIATIICPSVRAVSQIPPPSITPQRNNDQTVAGTDSLDSLIHIDPSQAPVATHPPATNHGSSLAIANANQVQNFRIEARDALDRLSTAAARITNNVPTVQMIDQIIGAVSDRFQAQQLCVQCEIQEQVKSTNACFATLAEQMQQSISTRPATANARNPPTPRQLPVSSRFHGKETRDIYIPNETLPETEPAQVFGGPLIHIKPKAPSTDTLYNNEFSCTPR